MNRGGHRQRANLTNTKCAKPTFIRPNSQKHTLGNKEIGLYFNHCYITTQSALDNKANEKTLYFCKKFKNTQAKESHKENSFTNDDSRIEQPKAEDQSNLITELKKNLSAKEAEILKLRHEKVKLKMELEDCRKELRIQTKKVESFKALFGESKTNAPFLNEV